jgi:hypothetical protein
MERDFRRVWIFEDGQEPGTARSWRHGCERMVGGAQPKGYATSCKNEKDAGFCCGRVTNLGSLELLQEKSKQQKDARLKPAATWRKLEGRTLGTEGCGTRGWTINDSWSN